MRNPWTPEDISKLKSMAGKMPAAKIAFELGRGFSATVVKAHELRVSLRYDGAPSSAVDPGAGEGPPVANR
jgi:hypothetical protein